MEPQPQAKKKTSRGLVAVIVLVAGGVLLVPCIGILAAVAIPAFIGYLTRAKVAEAETNLVAMFQGAAAYYENESWGGGGTANTNCVVGNGRTTNVPSSNKTLLGPLGEPFDSIGFALVDPVYFQYEIVSVGGCDHTDGEPLYTFRAYGDLDGDGTTSLFELAAGAGPDGTLSRSPGIHRENELE